MVGGRAGGQPCSSLTSHRDLQGKGQKGDRHPTAACKLLLSPQNPAYNAPSLGSLQDSLCLACFHPRFRQPRENMAQALCAG